MTLVMFAVIVAWTYTKKSDKPWSSFMSVSSRIAKPEMGSALPPSQAPMAEPQPNAKMAPRSAAPVRREDPRSEHEKAESIANKAKQPNGQTQTSTASDPKTIVKPPPTTPGWPPSGVTESSDPYRLVPGLSRPLSSPDILAELERAQARQARGQAIAKDMTLILTKGNELYSKCRDSDCQGDMNDALRAWYDQAYSCITSSLGYDEAHRFSAPLSGSSIASLLHRPTELSSDASERKLETLRNLRNRLDVVGQLVSEAQLKAGFLEMLTGAPSYAPCKL
jgi:hypothetical protein